MDSRMSTNTEPAVTDDIPRNRPQVELVRLIRQTVSGFCDDNVPTLGAALAFYTAFSTSPLFVIAIAISGFFLGDEAIRGQLQHELVVFVGDDAANGIQSMIAAASRQQHAGFLSSMAGISLLFFGATGVFVELKNSMNTIWQIERLPNTTLVAFLMDRLVSLVMVIGIAILLIVSLLMTTVFTVIEKRFFFSSVWMKLADESISFVMVLLLLSLIFKYLPDAIIQWEDVWLGSFVTAILFSIGKWCVAGYFVTFAISTSYGAVGSMAVFLLWTYYLSQILFFGAEMTRVYSEMSGKGIIPKRNARLKPC